MTILLPDFIMSAAVILGISGAALVAFKSPQMRRAGFSCWIFGNFIWLLEGAFTDNMYIVIMFGFYWITAVMGFFNTVKNSEDKNPGIFNSSGRDLEIR